MCCIDVMNEEGGNKYTENAFKVNISKNLKLSIIPPMDFSIDTELIILLGFG